MNINEMKPYVIYFIDDANDGHDNCYYYKNIHNNIVSIVTGLDVKNYFNHDYKEISDYIFEIKTASEHNQLNNSLFKNEFINETALYGNWPPFNPETNEKSLYLLSVRYLNEDNNGKQIIFIRHHLSYRDVYSPGSFSNNSIEWFSFYPDLGKDKMFNHCEFILQDRPEVIRWNRIGRNTVNTDKIKGQLNPWLKSS